MRGRPSLAGWPRLATTGVVLALLAGTSAALAFTQERKLERAPVTAPVFDRLFAPACGCETAMARLRFELRREDRVTAVVIDREGKSVRRLATARTLEPGRVTLTWDGRTENGDVARDGRYRLRLRLARERRTIVIPTTVRVDASPPRLSVLRTGPLTISPDGDGYRDHVQVVFRSGETAAALLEVDGAVAVRGRVRPPGQAKLVWGGTLGGRPLRAGLHRLALSLTDLAGNRSVSSEAAVRIRYVELAADVLEARAGGRLRFRVVTDAFPFAWELVPAEGGPGLLSGAGDRNVVSVRLPPLVVPGYYAVRVSAREHGDTALLEVSGKRR